MKKFLPHLPATGLTPVAAASAAAAGASASSAPDAVAPTKKRGRPRKAKPYQIDGRNGWWANPTLPDGSRPLRKFETEEKAAEWIAEQLSKAAQRLSFAAQDDMAPRGRHLDWQSGASRTVSMATWARLSPDDQSLLGLDTPGLDCAKFRPDQSSAPPSFRNRSQHAMPHLLLIVEPLGQRAERSRVTGEAVYQRMVDFSAELQAAGLLLGVNSLGTAARRLSKRDGGTQVLDGPFAEAKEMVGGYFLLDTEDAAVALAWAERCPAAEWATVEIRGVGPCYT